ncbi:MAG: tRNA lysidine(34) synthetase TilS, partial [Erysipelotrichaceae bacterium]
TYLSSPWVIGVSGGSDSMYLLELARQSQLQVHVAHVNYGVRANAKHETALVEHYCLRHGIPFTTLHAPTLKQGNFQAQARALRYAFYERLVQETHAKGVLLAHHLDDHLETYLLQTKRHQQVTWWGLREAGFVGSLYCVRPLLNHSKQDILSACKEQGIAYLDDESNFSTKYARNKVRLEVVQHLTCEQKQELLAIIEKRNQALALLQTQALAMIVNRRVVRKQWLRLEPDLQREVVIQLLLEARCYNLKGQKIEDILKLLYNEKNWRYTLNTKQILVCEYGSLYVDSESSVHFSYQLDALAPMQSPYFVLSLDETQGQGFGVTAADFPLTLRSARQGDRIKLKYGSKKIHRWFIDHKIPHHERMRWPVVENAQKEIIFVPGIGCDISHYSYNPCLFMVKCT